jgi:hypothetical protein
MITIQPQPTTFHEYSSHAINFDNLLHADSKNYGSTTKPSGNTSKATSSAPRTTAPKTTSSPSSASSDVVPMEINAVHTRRGPLTAEECQCRINNGLCTYCSNSSHYSNACPNKSEAAKKRGTACTASSTQSGKA